MTIEVRPSDGQAQRVTLPFAWSEADAGRVYVRILNVYRLVAEQGYSLRQAALVADGKAPKLTEQQDWPGAIERFKEQKLRHGTAIKPETWDAKYQPVLTDAIAE